MKLSQFAIRLKELRTAAGLTQGELAEKAGLSQAAISDIEQGRRAPLWETGIALVKALGVGCDVFLEEAAPAAPSPRGRPIKPSDDATASAPPEEVKAKGRKRK